MYDSQITNVTNVCIKEICYCVLFYDAGFLLFNIFFVFIFRVFVQIFCGGEECCDSCIIRSVSNIEVNGINSLSNCIIFSQLSNGNTMIVRISGMSCFVLFCFSLLSHHNNKNNKDNLSFLWNQITKNTKKNNTMITGTNNNEFNIYCNISNICKIECLSSDACSNLRLHCYEVGACFVDCDESNGINCPSYGVYGVWTTQEPSNIPSNNPTQLPSKSPSQLPSQLPSIIPTFLPTVNPSSQPTNVPSMSPTYNPSASPKNNYTTTGVVNDGTSNKNKNTLQVDIIILIIVVIVFCILITLCFMMILVYKNKKDERKIELKRLELQQSRFVKSKSLSMNNSNNSNGDTKITNVNLQRLGSQTPTVGSNYGDTGDGVVHRANSTVDDIMHTPRDSGSNKHNNNNNNIDHESDDNEDLYRNDVEGHVGENITGGADGDGDGDGGVGSEHAN